MILLDVKTVTAIPIYSYRKHNNAHVSHFHPSRDRASASWARVLRVGSCVFAVVVVFAVNTSFVRFARVSGYLYRGHLSRRYRVKKKKKSNTVSANIILAILCIISSHVWGALQSIGIRNVLGRARIAIWRVLYAHARCTFVRYRNGHVRNVPIFHRITLQTVRWAMLGTVATEQMNNDT